MKKTFMILLFVACTAAIPLADAAANMTTKKHPPVNVKRQSGTLTVTATAKILGLQVPVNLVVVTNNNTLLSVVTNLLGIAPPLNVSVGDVVNIDVPGSSQPVTFVVPNKNIFAGFDVKLLAEAFSVNVEVETRLQQQN
jgi:hypothetical protein